MSKNVEKFIVIESKGEFVASYKNRENGGLAFEAEFTEDVSEALGTPYQVIESNAEQRKLFENFAKAFNGRLVVVEAEYTFTDLDGKPVEIEEPQKKFEFDKLLNELAEGLGQMFGEEAGGDDED